MLILNLLRIERNQQVFFGNERFRVDDEVEENIIADCFGRKESIDKVLNASFAPKIVQHLKKEAVD